MAAIEGWVREASTYKAQGHVNCKAAILFHLPKKMNRWILGYCHSTDAQRHIPAIHSFRLRR